MGSEKNNKKRVNWTKIILITVLVIFLTGTGAVTGLFAVSLRDMPPWNPVQLKPMAATHIYDKNGEIAAKVGIENRIPVSYDRIPDVVKEAFLAAEDHRFFEHYGISFQGIMRAAWTDITSGKIVEGGSTITQQLVEMAYLSHEKKFKLKIQEIFLAFKAERHFSKEEILKMYLNRIYLGEGAYGVQAAAQKYFNKDIEKVTTLSEAATLAALPKAPSTYSPFQNYDNAIQRRNLILDNMAEYGFAEKEKVEKAKQQEITLNEGSSTKKEYPYPYYMDYVVHELIDKYGDEKVFKEGLNVYTALDPEIQTTVEKTLSNPDNYPYSRKNEKGVVQPQGAMVIMDPSNGYIRALVGGREHSHKRGLNRATRPQQPGSAFKPIAAYGPAIEQEGMGPASVIDDVPVEFPKYDNYSPHNFDYQYRGLITMRTALTRSVNVAAVKVLMNHVGIRDAIKFAQKLGINLKPRNHGPSMALGGLHKGVTPVQLAGAYGAFANQGLYNKPTAILKVTTTSGQLLYEHQPSPVQAMKPSTAFLITDMLKSVVTSGTGTRAKINRPMAGKTGTTEGSKDIWFAGYTRDYVGTVWIGHDNPQKMPGAYGGTYPAPIWRKVMSKIHKGIPERDFPMPGNIVRETVDSKSGLLPGPYTPEEHMVTDYFVKGTVPTKTDNVHTPTEVCADSGKLPTEYCPDRITKIMLKLPYKVPDKVQDSELRVPTEKCEMHDSPGDFILPGDGEFPGLPVGSGDNENDSDDADSNDNVNNNGRDKKQKDNDEQAPGSKDKNH